MNHAERYEYLVNKMAAIRWRGSDLDASYHAALFLMASHPALFQKMDRYLCPEGIDAPTRALRLPMTLVPRITVVVSAAP